LTHDVFPALEDNKNRLSLVFQVTLQSARLYEILVNL